jgi:hypothetical protein
MAPAACRSQGQAPGRCRPTSALARPRRGRITGGESGPRARYMPVEWARDVRYQCRAARVLLFVQQMNRRGPIPDDLLIREFPWSALLQGHPIQRPIPCGPYNVFSVGFRRRIKPATSTPADGV